MQDLRLLGVHEDGLRLLLAGPDGEHYTLPIDDTLRTAARRDRPRMGQLQMDIDGGMRPREVQSLIRAGGSTEEVADRAGWPVDKVRRYEGAILAERAHIADQARLVRVRTRGGSSSGTAPTLQSRVTQRMRDRGVEPEASRWDAWRAPDAKRWTVVLMFAAGGRQRQASWSYDPVLRSVEAADDEARWLSADEAPSAGPLPSAPPRAAHVYDVEAEGGVAATTRRGGAERAERADAGERRDSGERPDEPVDLMTAMRARTTVGRRSGRRRPVVEGRPVEPPALPLDGQVEIDVREVATEGARPAAVIVPQLVGPVGPVDPADPADPAEPVQTMETVGTGTPRDTGQPPETAAPEAAAEPDEPDEPDEAAAPDELEPFGSEVPPLEEPAQEGDPTERPDADERDSAEPEAIVDQPGPRAPKRKPRTSVPSWDDIMFGAKRE